MDWTSLDAGNCKKIGAATGVWDLLYGKQNSQPLAGQ